MDPAGATRSSALRRGLVSLTNRLLPGLYAWLTTVGSPATARGASLAARAAAFLALACLVAGPVVALERPRLGRALGVLAFVGFSLVTWLLLGPLIGVQRLEPLRAGLGMAGWALFALGWGSMRRADAVPEDHPHAVAGESLSARGALPRGAVAVVLLGTLAAAAPIYYAWTVTRAQHALLAHAVALACALGLVDAGSVIAVERGKWRPVLPPRRRLGAAARPLAVLTFLLFIGLLWKLFW